MARIPGFEKAFCFQIVGVLLRFALQLIGGIDSEQPASSADLSARRAHAEARPMPSAFASSSRSWLLIC